MSSQPEQKNTQFTGWNRLLQSRFLQTLQDKLDDGTFGEFLSDWKWIFRYSRKYKGFILLYILLGVLSSTLSLGSSVASKYMIDIIVGRQLSLLWLLAIIMVVSTVASVAFSSLVSRLSAKISIYVYNDIQADIFARVMDADWQALSEFESGDLLNRFNSDISTVANNAVNWLPDLIIGIYSFAATFAVICYYDVAMALIALASAPFLLLASRYLLRKMREHKKQVLATNSGMMSFESEVFYNMDTIKSFGAGKQYTKRLKGWQEQYREHNLAYNLFSIKTNAAMSSLSSLVTFAAFGYCLFRLWTDAISYGTMTLFLQQRAKLSSTFNSLVAIFPAMLSGSVSAHRIREITELPREQHDPSAARKLHPHTGDGLTVEFSGVSFGYRAEDGVLNGGDFAARPGEIVAIIGPSGEGKTTMLRMMLGLIHPAEGEVTLSAQNGARVAMNADLRHLFSYVPQGNTLLSGTIADNLRLGNSEATDQELEEALKIACAWNFVSRLPEGIHTKLGGRGKGVSEGQAQRLAIARALLRDGPILLLDEATSALDVETERQVLKNIVAGRPDKTCIITTHRPSVLNLCHRIYRVKDHHITQLEEDWPGLTEEGDEE